MGRSRLSSLRHPFRHSGTPFVIPAPPFVIPAEAGTQDGALLEPSWLPPISYGIAVGNLLWPNCACPFPFDFPQGERTAQARYSFVLSAPFLALSSPTLPHTSHPTVIAPPFSSFRRRPEPRTERCRVQGWLPHTIGPCSGATRPSPRVS